MALNGGTWRQGRLRCNTMPMNKATEDLNAMRERGRRFCRRSARNLAKRSNLFAALPALAGVCALFGKLPRLPSCLVPTQVFKEHGVLYATPYDYEVRVKLGCIAGRSIGAAIESAKEAQGLDENAELPSMFNSISPGWWSDQLHRGNVRVERCVWQSLEFEKIDSDYVVKEGDRARLTIHVHERAAPDVEIQVGRSMGCPGFYGHPEVDRVRIVSGICCFNDLILSTPGWL